MTKYRLAPETKEREAPPVSLCAKPQDRIGLLLPCVAPLNAMMLFGIARKN
jgi:hypothetical protein